MQIPLDGEGTNSVMVQRINELFILIVHSTQNRRSIPIPSQPTQFQIPKLLPQLDGKGEWVSWNCVTMEKGFIRQLKAG